MHKAFWWLTSVVYTIFLTIVSLINLKSVPKIGFSFDDKLYHLGAHIVLAFLWGWVALLSKKKNALVFSLIITLCYGVVMEMIQHKLNTTRTFDLIDMLFNGIGVVFGTVIATLMYKQKVKLN